MSGLEAVPRTVPRAVPRAVLEPGSRAWWLSLGLPTSYNADVKSIAVADAEAEWIRKARSGSREAFGQIVQLHQDAVMTTAHYLTRNREDAEDITQEVFLRAFRSMKGFAGQASLRTWLLTITTNTVRSLMTHRKAQKRTGPEVRIHSGPEGQAIDIPSSDDLWSPEVQAMRGELKEALEEAIFDLDEESRTAVVLRDLMEETYEAIAKNLGLPLGTVKSRIHRARLELRDRLQKLL